MNDGPEGLAGSLTYTKTTTNKKGKETEHNFSKAKVWLALSPAVPNYYIKKNNDDDITFLVQSV